MITKYVAFDGTEFEHEHECEEYELEKKICEDRKSLFDIVFWDKDGCEYTLDSNNIFEDWIYNHCHKIKIPTESWKDFRWWASYCGWSDFYSGDINHPGTWEIRRKRGVYSDEIWDCLDERVKINEYDLTEFIGQIIDEFEDFLDDKGIQIENPEKMEACEDGENIEEMCVIYGSDYDTLQTNIEQVLRGWGLIK